MKQININVTPEFGRALVALMTSRGIRSKSDAIRVAVAEAAERTAHGAADFRSWIGAGLKAPQSKRRQFRSEDDLWS